MIYKEFCKRRPFGTDTEFSPLYLQAKPERWLKSTETVWFKSTNMGKNRISELVAKGCEIAQVKRRTPHSGRKTCTKNLRREVIAPHVVKQITGHKSAQSIESYDKLDNHEHYELSKLLTRPNQRDRGHVNNEQVILRFNVYFLYIYIDTV